MALKPPPMSNKQQSIECCGIEQSTASHSHSSHLKNCLSKIALYQSIRSCRLLSMVICRWIERLFSRILLDNFIRFLFSCIYLLLGDLRIIHFSTKEISASQIGS